MASSPNALFLQTRSRRAPTGSEIAMRARYHLRQLATDQRLDAELRNANRELAEQVNATLES